MQKSSQRVAFLDGLRGWGALIVLAYHLFVEIYPVTPTIGATLFHLAPFNGHLAVVIFFIVSGYSLSVGFLQTGDRARLGRIFVGRYFRLAIPIFFATMLVYLAAKLALILHSDRSASVQSIGTVLRFSLFDVFFNNPLPMAFKTPIPQLWTMPIELAGSLLVVGLLWLTGVRRIRYLGYALALGILGWLMPLLAAFIVGIVLAEVNESGILERVRPLAGYLLIPSLAAAALLPGQGGIPYLAVATLIAFSTSVSTIGRRFLSNRLSRFLGEVSFPLYLLHGLVIFSYGTWIIGKASTPAFLLIANVSTVVMAVAVAWLFRWIDILGIKAAQLVSRRILTPNAADANEAGRTERA